MPDQSSASSEHALMQEITAPLAKLPHDPVPEVANVDFPVALRGYDRMAVDAYVRRTSQLVAELNASRSPETAVRRALERVGEEVAGILQRAHETAERITTKSRSEAEDRLELARREADTLLEQARGQAEQLLTEAQRRLGELDAQTEQIWSERYRIVEDARGLAAQLLALADSAVQRFPAEDEVSTEDVMAGQTELDADGDEDAEPREELSGREPTDDELAAEESSEEPASQRTLPIEPPEPFDQGTGPG